MDLIRLGKWAGKVFRAAVVVALAIGIIACVAYLYFSNRYRSENREFLKPISVGVQIGNPIPDDRPVLFSLKTSWDGGNEEYGTLRYIVKASPLKKEASETDPKLPEKMSSCTYSAELYDKSGFKISKFDLSFTTTVDSAGKPDAMESNDNTGMSRDTYRLLKDGGSWNILWQCR